jgi:hypothetical protein
VLISHRDDAFPFSFSKEDGSLRVLFFSSRHNRAIQSCCSASRMSETLSFCSQVDFLFPLFFGCEQTRMSRCLQSCFDVGSCGREEVGDFCVEE